MTVSSAIRCLARPVPQWEPPLSGGQLATVLSKLHTWQAFDGDVLLDDVATALDDVPPAEQDVEEVTRRLRGHLMRLVNIAIAAEAGRDDVAAYLIERARALGVEELSGDHRKAVGQLRRMGWIVNELFERLVVTRCLKEAS